MATETAEQKKAREEEEAKKLQAAEEEAKKSAAKVTITATPATPPAVPFVPTVMDADTQKGEAEKDSSVSGETSSPNTPQEGKAPSLLDQILLEQTPEPTFVPTYNQNRWKVGAGHSMLGQWVEGQEIDVVALSNLGSNDTERRASLERLLRLGAIVRMGDHEPQGGVATGHLAPLHSQVGATNPSREAAQILMGPDMRERIDGQATAQEVRDRTRR